MTEFLNKTKILALNTTTICEYGKLFNFAFIKTDRFEYQSFCFTHSGTFLANKTILSDQITKRLAY